MGVRIHFDAGDLRKVTIAQQPAPLWDIERSLRALQVTNAGAAYAPWRAWARMRLPRTAHQLLTLVPPTGPCPDFLTPTGPSPDLESGLDQVLSTPRPLLNRDLGQLAERRRLPPWAHDLGRGSLPALRSLGRALRDYHQAAIHPLQHRLAADYETVTGGLTQTLSQRGLDALLSNLHPSIRWNPPVLDVGHPLYDDDVHLNGWGLHLVPSFFTPTNAFCVNHTPPMTVTFPITTQRAGTSVRHRTTPLGLNLLRAQPRLPE
ncbi:ArsR family transcriptional regulator [Streptomyces aurantiacus]|uniref:Transcriptional regulator n=1 Tax=Streptomyces aurantiacus JA 4570 TaxID=1286094 RepID=S3ZT86_9ACTN|nr:hypothetical protein [Streptomyces aurantiacus]EPH46616.1 hypothetical protein STRAU_0355 [Streptomyces aurantiacus JA 4570]